jgi:type VI secretion system protein ImpA
MPSPALNPVLLSSALPGDLPCGADLADDPVFFALQQAAAGKPDRQYGDKHYPAEPPNWMSVYENAMQLALRTRDLRVAVWLTRSGAHLHGFAGFAAGLSLIHLLVSQHWDALHPALDESDHNDPTLRMNTLLQLAAWDAGLADVRSARIAPGRVGPTVRDIELSLGRGSPHAGEVVPTEQGMVGALQELLADHTGLAGDINAACQAIDELQAALATRVTSEQMPELDPLAGLLHMLDKAMSMVSGQGVGHGGSTTATDASAASAAGPAASATAAAAAHATGPISSRADAIRQLAHICDWIEQHEPSNPVPLLLRRAQRLMDRNFLEIIRDMAPNGLAQVELIAGTVDAKP